MKRFKKIKQVMRLFSSSFKDTIKKLVKLQFEGADVLIAIDLTQSNRNTGLESFKRGLHDPDSNGLTAYSEVILKLGRMLKSTDADLKYELYGFGDQTTCDHSVLSLGSFGTVEDLNKAYLDSLSKITLYGPTSFAPAINKAIESARSDYRHKILVILADGEVNTPEVTLGAIADASNYPISIVTIGIGDADFKTMEKWDDLKKGRKFDNFQFVEYKSSMSDDKLAVKALEELPKQFKYMKDHNLFQRPVTLPQFNGVNTLTL